MVYELKHMPAGEGFEVRFRVRTAKPCVMLKHVADRGTVNRSFLNPSRGCLHFLDSIPI